MKDMRFEELVAHQKGVMVVLEDGFKSKSEGLKRW